VFSSLKFSKKRQLTPHFLSTLAKNDNLSVKKTEPEGYEK